MKNITLHLLALIIATTIICTKNCHAQDVHVKGSIDKDSILAGQPFNYHLNITAPDKYIIDWNEFNDTLSKSVEIISKSEPSRQEIKNSNDILFTQRLTLTTFDTGYVEIPSMAIKYSKSAEDTTIYTSYTDFMDIYVKAVPIDTTMAYKPIKMPIRQSITFEETIPYISGSIILALLIMLLIIMIRRSRKKEKVDEVVKPQIPAIVTAREKMSTLKDANLWQSGKYKEYYTALTDIAREYLEGQFNIEAIEMTSDEIIEEVKKIHLDDLTFAKLRDTLLIADLVKFAKANPNAEENEKSFSNVNTFIEESYIIHQESEKKKAEEAKSSKHDTEENNKTQEMEETK